MSLLGLRLAEKIIVVVTPSHEHSEVDDDDSTVKCSDFEQLPGKSRPLTSSRKLPPRGPLLVKREPTPSRPAPGSMPVDENREPVPLRPPPNELSPGVYLSKPVVDLSEVKSDKEVQEVDIVKLEEDSFDAEMTQMQPAKRQPSDQEPSVFDPQPSDPFRFFPPGVPEIISRENRYDQNNRFRFVGGGRPWHETRQVWLGAMVAVFLIFILAVITLAFNSKPKAQSVTVRSISSKSLHPTLSTMEPKGPESVVSEDELVPEVVASTTAVRSAESTRVASQSSVFYKNCDVVKAAGADPLKKGQPGFSEKLDVDGDGVACDT